MGQVEKKMNARKNEIRAHCQARSSSLLAPRKLFAIPKVPVPKKEGNFDFKTPLVPNIKRSLESATKTNRKNSKTGKNQQNQKDRQEIKRLLLTKNI